MVAWGLSVLAGSWSEPSVESDADTTSALERTMVGAFLRSKPAAHNNLGSMVSEEVAARRAVDTHLACICFSFLAALNASDVLKKPDSS